MISVVIPALNEEKYLPACLTSLSSQSYKDFETIVVVNGDDNTASIARSFGAAVIRVTEKGIALARQTGFNSAKGEIIASTDADTVVPPDWLQCIDGLFKRHHDADAVAGHFVLYDGPVVVRTWIKTSLVLMPGIIKTAPWLWNFGGFNFAVRKHAFFQIGGFNLDLDFGEDVDLCRRLKNRGRVFFDPHLVVRMSGRAFLKDRLGLKNFSNYISVLVRGKPCLPVVHGSEIKIET